jgi:pectate disaccharide-lyase
MKKSRIQILLFFLLMATMLNVVDAQQSLIIKFNDGINKGTLLSNLNKITFASGNMLVKYADASADSYAMSTMNRMTFGIYSAVPELASDQTELVVYPNPASSYIQLRNYTTDFKLLVKVYSLDGTLVLSNTLVSADERIDVSLLRHGMYLLKVNEKTIKFIKQ